MLRPSVGEKYVNIKNTKQKGYWELTVRLTVRTNKINYSIH